MSKSLIFLCALLFFSCGVPLYIGNMPNVVLINGTFVNSNSPMQDTFIIDHDFTLITKDGAGNTQKFHGNYFEYFPPYSDIPANGTAWARFKSPDDRRTWMSKVHFESTDECSHLLVLDTFYQFINFTIKEEIARKVDSLRGIKRNAQGLPFRFVKCIP
jgi:hypothetical protein